VPIRVREVAEVRDGAATRRGAVTAEGRGESILGLAFMLMGENSHQVARRVDARVREVQRALPPDVKIVPVYDRTHLVEEVMHTAGANLLEGALLVIAVLLAFLGSVRAGLIVAAAIPLSLLFAGNFMARLGIAASLMSLGAIDFGMVVDSSVVLVENAARRVRQAGPDAHLATVVRDAALEVRRPTLFGELIILLVYVPVLALEGIEGKLFRPMVLTVMLCILGSLVFSLTLMPALASLFLRRPRPGRVHRETLLIRLAQRLYNPTLELALRHKALVIGGAIALLAGTGLLATRLGSEFLPRLSEGSIVINTVRATGVTLEESVRYSTRLEQILLEEFPHEIEHVWSRTGTAEVATDPMGIELTDVFLTLKPRREWRRARTQGQLVGAIEASLAGLPGMRTVFTQPIEMRMNEMIAGIRSDLAIRLFGDDLDSLKSKAAEIAEVVSRVPGASDVMAEQITGQPVLEIRPDREKLGRHGVSMERVLEVVESVGGRTVGEIREGQRRFPIAVWLAEPYRSDPEALGRVPVPTSAGGTVPLGDLVSLRLYEGPSTVTREWARRRVAVQANVRGRDVGSFVHEARERVREEVRLQPGTFLRWGGSFEHLVRARNRLAVVVPLALLLILGLLYWTYGRWRDALRVFTGVPFAAVGGVLALALRGLPFSVSAAIGFVALSGVAVLDDMILVSFIRQEFARGAPAEEAVRNAARVRLRPVLMTALVAAFGFLPMALNTGVGSEVQRPLATVVVGGVVSSTLLTLVVLPAMYLVMGSGKRSRKSAA
jgi:cobalt-zinc-cadmium resistance protein CzcA